MVNISEEWLPHPTASDVYHRTWEPTAGTPVRATVVFAHGIGEHVCRYDHVFSPFADAGIKVRSWDQRGFGQTVRKNGILGHNESYATVLEDMDEAAKRVKVQGVPHFVMGHSMGGGIALAYALKNAARGDIRGVIASAPLIHLGPKTAVSTPEYYAVRAIASLFSTFAMSNPVDANNLSRDPAVVEAYKADPLVHAYTSMGTARDIVLNGESLTRNAHNFKLPVLVTCGTNDHIVSYKHAKQWHVLAASEDKTWKSFEGLCHELHNEPERDEVIKLYVDWILARI
ncbi:hypothetical protein PhCBS80983_g02562 [Powellomyces hirtus]|uniref:Serine aminopeptidase S33 domain-containing protein n=1 Tax=Powellomyces hirtus TaxID=109895 RepID=A0A507E793_9FUNG|nr:hypothetical protein PhCBS80983_g02562 [Powellomyces hirtus]